VTPSGDSPTAPAGSLSPEAEAFVNSVGAATDLPAFVRNVRAIGTVAQNLDARVALLEDAIIQDVALTARILRIANSVALSTAGPGASIESIKQAIMLLGYDRVQHLSMASSVFEKLEQDAPSVRDLLVESVLAANHSLQLSLAVGYDRPEQAYLCALFRRLGEVLVACYRPRPYHKWLQHLLAGGAAHDGAESAHFQFTFEEVGIALARRWGMPSGVVRTMRVFRGVSLEGDPLHAITQCSVDIARCLYGAVPAARGVTADGIREQYAKAIGLDVQGMTECVAPALADARPTLSSMQVDLEAWLVGHADSMAAARARQTDTQHGVLQATPPVALTPEDVEQEVLQGIHARLAPHDHDTPREAQLRDAVRHLVHHRQQESSDFSVGSVTDSTLRAACAAGYERGVLGISSEDFKLIRGRMGIGRGSTELARNFLLRPTPAFGPLGAALHLRSDLFIELTGADARLYGRDRLVKELAPSHFALLPLVLEAKLIGCLYFDSTMESVETTDTSRDLLCALRDQLVAAFARHRAGTNDTAALTA
jgi:HD-like signal output (HDOD) protein/GAF domain-containing protein